MSLATKRAFIFSIDSFIAFTIALSVIYAMIFFSSVPSAYYATLAQAHSLSRDILLTLSSTKCDFDQSLCGDFKDSTVLDRLIFQSSTGQRSELVKSFIGTRIPNQYGYTFEIYENNGWVAVYDSATDSDTTNLHKKTRDKISVSSYIPGFAGTISPPENPYSYNTCNGGTQNPPATICSTPSNGYTPGEAVVKLAKLTIYT